MLQSTVTGFNVNLDRTIPVTRELLSTGPFARRDMAEYRMRLIHSMETCTAEEYFVHDWQPYQDISALFPGSGGIAIGGQAGVAAVHLASIGVENVVCVTGSLGNVTREILRGAGVTILEFDAGITGGLDTIHLIFEYPPGLIRISEGVIPRSNRFIVSPAHEPSSVLIPEGSMGRFLTDTLCCTRAFLSGYHYLDSEREFCAARDQIREMKRNNRNLKIHVEWVSPGERERISRFIHYILPETDSLGLNEQELRLISRHLNPGFIRSPAMREVSPVSLSEEALEICRTAGLARMHVHTFGYYILIFRKEPVDPEGSRNALLFASREVCRAAGGVAGLVSPEGTRATGQVAGVFGEELSRGIFCTGGFYVILVPALMVPAITRTAGMGDRISSAAFAADPL